MTATSYYERLRCVNQSERRPATRLSLRWLVASRWSAQGPFPPSIAPSISLTGPVNLDVASTVRPHDFSHRVQLRQNHRAQLALEEHPGDTPLLKRWYRLQVNLR